MGVLFSWDPNLPQRTITRCCEKKRPYNTKRGLTPDRLALLKPPGPPGVVEGGFRPAGAEDHLPPSTPAIDLRSRLLMITSFFRPKGEATSAEAPAAAAASSAARPTKRPLDEACGAGAEDTPSEPTVGVKSGRRRKATIRDSDDEDEGTSAADITPVPPPLATKPEVTPQPAAHEPSVPMEMDSQGAAASTPATEANPAAASSTGAATKPADAARPAAPAKASGKAHASGKAPAVAADGPRGAKADSDEEMEEDEEEDECEEEDEEEADEAGGDATAAPASKKAKPKAGGKGGKGSGKAVVGATAAKIAYHKYDALAAATWKAGEAVPYLFLARVFGRIEAESKRLLIIELMANAFRTIIATTPEDVVPLMAVATNKLAPAYEGVELGIGDSIMIKAVSETCGRSVDAIKSEMEEVGDLGEVAMASRTKQVTLCKPKPLQVRGVFKALKEIAMTSGERDLPLPPPLSNAAPSAALAWAAFRFPAALACLGVPWRALQAQHARVALRWRPSARHPSPDRTATPCLRRARGHEAQEGQDQADARRRAGEGGAVHRALAAGQDAHRLG